MSCCPITVTICDNYRCVETPNNFPVCWNPSSFYREFISRVQVGIGIKPSGFLGTITDYDICLMYFEITCGVCCLYSPFLRGRLRWFGPKTYRIGGSFHGFVL